MLKDIPPEQLVLAVRTVAQGGALLAPSVTRRLIGQFASQRAVDADLAARLQDLTARERDVVVAVAKGRSNAEIASELFIGPATVKSHVSSVLTKLSLRDRAQIAVVAYEGGARHSRRMMLRPESATCCPARERSRGANPCARPGPVNRRQSAGALNKNAANSPAGELAAFLGPRELTPQPRGPPFRP